jgi:hypothetical protein
MKRAGASLKLLGGSSEKKGESEIEIPVERENVTHCY